MQARTKTRLLGLCILGSAALVSAHGVVESPPSRTWICGQITKPSDVDFGTPEYPVCAEAFKIDPMAAYNFMAVVTHTLGRSTVTPLPKNVCGFDGETWKGAPTPWDVPMEWPTTPMSAGKQSFTWNITWGAHFEDTRDFSYWITKPGFVFSPAKALSWDDFEVEPFCMLMYDDSKPTANPNVTADKAKGIFKNQCNVPDRSGHHVIYSEWGRIAPTFERFHGCVDVAFGGTGISPRMPGGAKGMNPKSGSGKAADALGRTRKIQTGIRMLNPLPGSWRGFSE
jgi:chitin-binding protein